MISDVRKLTVESMAFYGDILNILNGNKNVLEVGIAGDEKPGGNYKYFGVGNNYKTMDNVALFRPDIVADICDTKLESDSWDLIILSQTLEHVKDPQGAISECYRLLRGGGHLIVDCPFYYPYHAEPEFGDYWRVSDAGMKLLLFNAGFEVTRCVLKDMILTTALGRKPKYV